MAQKLAIAMSGSVSLGSYEAGVIYEIIEAIAQHNSHPDTQAEQRIEIDVITGASAGAITACILTQKLLFEAEALRQPYANALHGPWVEATDIHQLLRLRPREDPRRSILSADHLAEIGFNYVLRRYATGQPTPRQRHPAAAAQIRLGIALSNLNGVDTAIEMADFPDVGDPGRHSHRQFTYRRYADFFSRTIQDSDRDDNSKLWRRIETIARASASFPFAFRLQPVMRRGSDPSYVQSQLSANQRYSFAYTDGSLFEQPLGLAKDLVDQIDRQHLNHHSRFYLSVAAGVSQSGQARLQAGTADMNLATALVGAIFTQAQVQNWIGTSKINAAIRQFEHQAHQLSDVLLKSPQLQTAFSQVADQLLAILYSQDQPQQIADQTRLQQQFTEEYDRLVYAARQNGSEGSAIAESWLKLVQALEKLQRLGQRDVMTVYALTSENLGLAGEQLFGLGGFLDPSFREFDYNVGRRQATAFLTQLQAMHQQGKGEGQLYLTNFVAGQTISPTPAHLEVNLAQVPKLTRLTLKTQLLDRCDQMIDGLKTRFWLRHLLKVSLRLFLSQQLNRLLKLG